MVQIPYEFGCSMCPIQWYVPLLMHCLSLMTIKTRLVGAHSFLRKWIRWGRRHLCFLFSTALSAFFSWGDPVHFPAETAQVKQAKFRTHSPRPVWHHFFPSILYSSDRNFHINVCRMQVNETCRPSTRNIPRPPLLLLLEKNENSFLRSPIQGVSLCVCVHFGLISNLLVFEFAGGSSPLMSLLVWADHPDIHA